MVSDLMSLVIPRAAIIRMMRHFGLISELGRLTVNELSTEVGL
jgi:hypothetical protein